MKHIYTILIALFFFSSSWAQQGEINTSNNMYRSQDVQTLISPKTRVGGYISLESQFKDFGQAFPGVYNGVRIGAVFNRYLFIGLGAYGLVSEVKIRDFLQDGEDVRLNTGYGGLSVEPILFPKKVVHLTFPMFAGIGLAEVREGFDWGWQYDSDIFWNFNVGANVEFNVTKWFRISGGAYFNDTEDFNLLSTPRSTLNGLSYGGSLKFGRF